MSRYLVARIEASPEITVKPHTEVEALEGNGHLERVTWRDGLAAASETHEIRHVFLMTGANPNTGWLKGCFALDEKQFIKTGSDLGDNWSMRRPPFPLEDEPSRRFRRRGYPVRQREARGVGSGRRFDGCPVRPPRAG